MAQSESEFEERFRSAGRINNTLRICYGSVGDAELVSEPEYEVGPKSNSDDDYDSEYGTSSKRKANSDSAGSSVPSPKLEPSLNLSRRQNDRTVIGQYRASRWAVIGPVTSLAERPISFMAMNTRARTKLAKTTLRAGRLRLLSPYFSSATTLASKSFFLISIHIFVVVLYSH